MAGPNGRRALIPMAALHSVPPMRRALVLVLVGTAACASGTPGNPDAKEQKFDAPANTPDTPISTPDGRPDAVTPVPDARIFDASIADANIADAPVIADARPADA